MLKNQSSGELKAHLTVTSNNSDQQQQQQRQIQASLHQGQVRQPEEARSFHSALVEVMLPVQPDRLVGSMEAAGLALGLVLFRPPKQDKEPETTWVDAF